MSAGSTEPRVAIVGTAGRGDDTARMSLALHEAMLLDAGERIVRCWGRPVHLISGGAAWADHVAVGLYLYGLASKLTLYLPAPLDVQTGRFAEHGGWPDVGRTANYYHDIFRRMTGIDGRAQIREAQARGAELDTGPGGFKARNMKVAHGCTELWAYTWGQGAEPKDGGTAHTWGATARQRKPVLHVSLWGLASALGIKVG